MIYISTTHPINEDSSVREVCSRIGIGDNIDDPDISIHFDGQQISPSDYDKTIKELDPGMADGSRHWLVGKVWKELA